MQNASDGGFTRPENMPTNPRTHSGMPPGLGSSRARSQARMRHAKAATIAEAMQYKSKRKTVALWIAIVAIVLIVAGCVGVYAYFKTTNANLDLGDSNAKNALAAPQADDAFYMLCGADLSLDGVKSQPSELQGFMLVRVDENARSLTFATIPDEILVRKADGSIAKLKDLKDDGDDAALITALDELLGIEINHYAQTDARHLSSLVDFLGGVNVNIVEEIDDPRISTKVLYAGEQLLTGEDALIFLRATNVTGSFEKTAQNRVDFTVGLIAHALSSEGLNFASAVSDASSFVNTDLSAESLLSLGDKARPFDTMTIRSCMVPTYNSVNNSGEVEMNLYRDKWRPMLEKMNAGEDPSSANGVANSFAPQDVTVEIRNGTSMNGVAAKLGEVLAQRGYAIKDVGNVQDATIYPETLIVYTDPQFEGAANALMDEIGCGRVVNGGDYYTSEANVIVIIGLNYIPPA